MKEIIKPTKQVVTFRAPYRDEKSIAAKLDLQLAIEFSRFGEEEPEVVVRIENESNKNLEGAVILNDEEAGQALLNYFLQNAKRYPRIKKPKPSKPSSGAGLIGGDKNG